MMTSYIAFQSRLRFHNATHIPPSRDHMVRKEFSPQTDTYSRALLTPLSFSIVAFDELAEKPLEKPPAVKKKEENSSAVAIVSFGNTAHIFSVDFYTGDSLF